MWDKIETLVNYILGGVIVGLAVYIHNRSAKVKQETKVEEFDQAPQDGSAGDGKSDAAMMAQMRREGIIGLTPHIINMTPIKDVFSLI